MSKVLGIDLGTTYSCVAYIDEFEKSVVIKNAEGDNTTPSVVYFESLENIIVGEEAKNMLVVEPDSTVAFVKRNMGADDLDGNPMRFSIHGKDISPEEISSKILKKLVKDANSELQSLGVLSDGEEINDVVITCPAYFGMREKAATKVAGELAGLNVLDIINEPTAAAINYGVLKKQENKNVMVYDLGGGTFDVTIIKIDGQNINVVYSDGDRSLGGKDWDEKISDYLASEFNIATGVDFLDDEEAANDIVLISEKAKKALSSKTVTKVALRSGGKSHTVNFTREKFNEITSTLLETTLIKTNECLNKAASGEYKIGIDQIDEILLVGGSSKMPQIKETLDKKYNKDAKLFDPDEAVAKGAAIYAEIRHNYEFIITEIAKAQGKSKSEVEEAMEAKNSDLMTEAKKYSVNVGNMGSSNLGGLNAIKISDTLSRTYGQELYDTRTNSTFISNILMKGSKLPVELSEKSYTLEEGQTGCLIAIYESESNLKEMGCNEGKLLGEARLDFGKALPKNTEIITKLKMENSGLIYMVATEATTGARVEAQFTPSGGLNRNEMMAATFRAENDSVN